MKQERTITIIAYLFGVCGVIELVGKHLIMGGALIAFGAICLYIKGSGKLNQRSQYEKIVDTKDYKIEDVYERLKNVKTPLGKAWIAEHVGFPGKSVIFGPTKYNDIITISIDPKKPRFNMRHINKLENVRTLNEEDDRRFAHCLNLSETKLTPKAYAEFVSYKIASVCLLNYLMAEVEKMVDGNEDRPAAVGNFKLYQCNSSDCYVTDMKGNKYMRLLGQYRPFVAKGYDADDEEMTNIVPRRLDKKQQAIDSYGFDMYSEGEHYAGIVRKSIDRHDAFRIDAGGEEFAIVNFSAVQRANVKSNYYIYKGDELLAIIASIPNIEFEDIGQCRQYVIMSYNDDYLVLYASSINFVTTLNNFIK